MDCPVVGVAVEPKIWRPDKSRKFEGFFTVIWLILALFGKKVWGNDMVKATITYKLLDEMMCEAINQIRH